MASANPSAMLADSLSDFSKAAYKAFTEVEAQARQEVARAVNETCETKMERDIAVKDLHNSLLDLQSWKQELAASKAALAQAELTISHQSETHATQVETISQLRRELAQWKDQSRNWQEHFLRVEQERCAQTSRIDELMENLQYSRQSMHPSALFTPKGPNYTTSINSAPSSTTTKRPSVPSPTQPPAYKTAAPVNSEELEYPNVPATQKTAKPLKAKRAKPKPHHLEPVADDVQEASSSASKRARNNANAESRHTLRTDAPFAPRHSTVIRRVHAVINVKQEESEDESPHNASSSLEAKEESLGAVFASGSSPKRGRASRSRVILAESDYESEEYRSGSEQPRRLRNRSRINYEEEVYEEEDEEDDELMLGGENNHEEIFGTSRDVRRPTKQAPAAPPKKKRKFVGR